MKKLLLLYILSALTRAANAQDNNYGVKGFYPQTFPVADSSPAFCNGLKAGYSVETESVKDVGKKGDFSRYKIKFWLTNTSSEAKIMYRNSGFMGHAGPMTNNIALFKCLNATGARMTNKMASMDLQPCKLEALVDGQKVLADIGFWIKPGETVSKTYPMITPLNEKPVITVTFYPEVANQTGSLIDAGTVQESPAPSFVRIKNFSSNTYLNNQSGSLTCSNIETGWWSADWEIVPVNGTENFHIRNRWKNTYLSAENGMLTDNPNIASAIWSIQETNTSDVFYIKAVSNNARLYVDNGQLKISNSFINNDNASRWIIEK